jgi:phosphoribosylformimino-5-aminoimidazole carboxamide ribotide isomerase
MVKIFPSIDLIDGNVVRLIKGNYKKIKKYDENPVSIAKKWEIEGADGLHIIDLDAAFGIKNNIEIILKIVKSVKIPVQVGGGIREMKKVQFLINNNVAQIILGTMAFNNLNLLDSLVKDFGTQKIIVALDYLSGKVMIKGWQYSTNIKVENAIKKFKDHAIENFLITSVDKDGTLSGPDLSILKKLYKYSDVNIIYSGGISKLSDLIKLNFFPLKGIIIGKALYENNFTLKEAIVTCKEKLK